MNKTPLDVNFNSSKRIDFTEKKLHLDFFNHNLNYINKKSFFNFKDSRLNDIFHSFFPIVSKNRIKTLSLKKVVIGGPERSFYQVLNELGSYEYPINLHFLLNIKESGVKITNAKIYRNYEELFCKWLMQKLEFAQPHLLKKKDNHYFFTDFKTSKTSKLKIKISVVKVQASNLIFDFNLETEEKIFFGNYPMITENSTFLINGNEKVVVFQLSRAPGVYFNSVKGSGDFDFFSAEIIPGKGTWIDFVIKNIHYKSKENESSNLPVLELVLDKNRTNNVLLVDLLTIFGVDKNSVLEKLNNALEITNSYKIIEEKDSQENSIKRVYSKLSNTSANVSLDNKFNTILNFFFEPKRFLLSGVGRYKLNHKLFLGNVLYGRMLAQNLVAHGSKKVIFPKGTLITRGVLPKIKEFLKTGNNLVNLNLTNKKIAGPNRVQVVKVYADNDTKNKLIKLLGIDPNFQEEHLNVADLLVISSYLLNLGFDVGKIDDIDSLANRNVKTLDELLEFYFRKGLNKVRIETTKRLNDVGLKLYNHKIISLISSSILHETVKEFFNISQLSQFLDQNNPLTELSNKRRLTVLGESGLKRESASSKVRDIHHSYSGKICPIETPEGPNIGLITNLAFFASLNKWKFLQTPYWKVKNGAVIKKVVWLSALEEENAIIAPSTTLLDEENNIIAQKLQVYLDDNLITFDTRQIEYMGYSSQQMFSASAACIPFLEHNDANRALMGANMQKQAVPLIHPEAPLVGTGNEKIVARDSGFAIAAKNSGKVVYADSTQIKIQTSSKDTNLYKTLNFLPSNQRTALFHNLLVKKDEKVEKGQIIADGVAIKNGELAIGKNLLVAFMTWKGYNFEDAIIISDRLVREDVLTSLHIEEYEIRRMRTNLGEEKFTDQIPNTSPKARRYLDENGIVLLGSKVLAGDILVGKVTPKDKGKKTPEDLLLNQLFKGREQNVENNSLVMPTGTEGIVQKIEHYFQKDYGGSLSADVIEIAKIYIVHKNPIKVGDKLANRHGNKGIVSCISPENSMPYLADGTSIDIMVNPLGVPSRMNVGQLLEMHLSLAADVLGEKLMVPIFSGNLFDKLKTYMAKAGLDSDGKTVLYDGETGHPFAQKVAIGKLYYLKLSHMVETKIHARNIGPYALITQQPLKGKVQNGGQRFGEMEVWALQSYGAAYNLQELLTIKSDDIKGRNRIFNAIINDDTKNFDFNHYPESFNVLLAEMRSLCLNVEILEKIEDSEEKTKEEN